MGDCMTFNDNPMDFIKIYSFRDTEELYTNGAELIPVFRVEQMMDHYMPKWIPVTERLPEDDSYIMLSFENFSVPLVGRYDEDEEGSAFYAGDDDESCISQDIVVNAWMPLPEPYRELELAENSDLDGDGE